MARSYRFGAVEVRPSERQLLVKGQPAPVGARAFDVLLALIDNRDRVVTKDELLDMVWPGLVVEENNLQVQVSTLRKILGSQAVATIPGRGYRFTLVPEGVPDAPSCPIPARRHNLPAALNSFVGRDKELAEVRAILGASRLVTLTSTGGTGKTRLSLQLAGDLLGEFPDGVWLVDLAPVADAEQVAPALAFVFEVKEEPERALLDTLAGFVRDRRLLIVLDNCEHLLRPCAELAKRLLVSGAGVQIIATSRERLNITGETNYPLPALAVPKAGATPAAADLLRFESVRLFVDRAAASLPSFRLTDANAPFVAEICRKLDGIPLAIELAAARMHALAPEEIAQRLGESLRLLTGGDVTAQPRQQALRASIDWSYSLLSEPEKALFRRLAVFAGSWPLEAAQAVAALEAAQDPSIVEILARLVSKSLVVHEAAAERYRLLETVRQYAQELIAESGEEAAVRTRHLEHYVAFAERVRPHLTGPEQAVWLARVDFERENLLSAHAWCDKADQGAELGLRLACALRHYGRTRGLLHMGLRMLLQALARPGAQVRDRRRCRALADVGHLAYHMGRYGDARLYLEESLAIARELGDTRRIAAALQPLGMACLGQGEIATARRHLEEALVLANELGEKRDIAAAMNQLAQLHRVDGKLDAAEPLYERMLEIARELHDRETIAIGLLNVAMTSITRGIPDRARLMLSEAAAIAVEIGSKPVGQSVLEVCAGLASLRQDGKRAAHFYGAAEAQVAQTGIHRDPADEAFLVPLIAGSKSVFGATDFDAAEETGRALPYDEAIREARAWLQSPA